jgi:hypothetical protein
MKRVGALLACGMLWMLGACAATRVVRTLGKAGATELSSGAGGLLSSNYEEANPPPIPVIHAGARRGVNERLDVFADGHLGAAVFGLAWLDAGAAYALWAREPGPYLLVSSKSHLITNFRDIMLLQQLDVVASVRVYSFTPYVGWASIFELWPALDYLPVPFLGGRYDFTRWFLQTELRWYAPWSDGRRATSHYLSPGGAGALGVSISFGVRL